MYMGQGIWVKIFLRKKAEEKLSFIFHDYSIEYKQNITKNMWGHKCHDTYENK